MGRSKRPARDEGFFSEIRAKGAPCARRKAQRGCYGVLQWQWQPKRGSRGKDKGCLVSEGKARYEATRVAKEECKEEAGGYLKNTRGVTPQGLGRTTSSFGIRLTRPWGCAASPPQHASTAPVTHMLVPYRTARLGGPGGSKRAFNQRHLLTD